MSATKTSRSLRSVLARWCIPPGFRDLLLQSAAALSPEQQHRARLSAANAKYRNKHQGERCFIVCSGPSVKQQNLLPLRNEITFFVSTGFLHPDYAAIQPAYHCTPSHEQTPRFLEWFKRMDASLGSAQLFLGAADATFVRQNGLFQTRNVSYVNMGLLWNRDRSEIYDLTRRVPGVQSSPIMALLIAMYMGFKEIYLLGVDLDQLWSGEYRHFYDDETLRNVEAVNEDFKVVTPLQEMFNIHHILWQQFESLKNIADANGVRIFNATRGGALDVYPRAKFEGLFDA